VDVIYVDAEHCLRRAFSPVRCGYNKSVFDRSVSSGVNAQDMILQDSWNRAHFLETLTPLVCELCRLRWSDGDIDIGFIVEATAPPDMAREIALQILQGWSHRNLGAGVRSMAAWSERTSQPVGRLYRRSVAMRNTLQGEMSVAYSTVQSYLHDNNLL
tara:strand:+ start:108 stop:581 length:474 start_codon:yes stop_codon:yes gene_type:complete